MKFSLDKLKSTFSNMKAISTKQNSSSFKRSSRWKNTTYRREFFNTEAIEKIIKNGSLEEIIA